MTMHNKICFLLVVLLMVVAKSKCADSTGKKEKRAITYVDPPNGQDKTERADGKSQQHSYGSSSNGIPYDYYITNYPGSSSSAGVDTSSLTKVEPTCYSVLDLQFPQFADLCGTLPQTRYSLPNSLGHMQRWQIAQVLGTLLSSATLTSPSCYRSLRLLICPLLFPPCPTRDEPAAVLPCQSFCRAVKMECQAPSLNLLPCDFLPAVSNMCPVKPAPYYSSYSQPMQVNSGVQPMSQIPANLASLLAQSAVKLSNSPSIDSSPEGRSITPTQPNNQPFNSGSYSYDPTSPVLINFPYIPGY